jgi:hypothetical protein
MEIEMSDQNAGLYSEKLFGTVDKAIQTAIRVLEEASSTVSDDEYYAFLQLLNNFQLPAFACCFGAIDGATDAIAYAMHGSIPYKGLDLLKAALWNADLDEDRESEEGFGPAAETRRDNIEHLRTMLAYWRAGSEAVYKRQAAE